MARVKSAVAADSQDSQPRPKFKFLGKSRDTERRRTESGPARGSYVHTDGLKVLLLWNRRSYGHPIIFTGRGECVLSYGWQRIQYMHAQDDKYREIINYKSNYGT